MAFNPVQPRPRPGENGDSTAATSLWAWDARPPKGFPSQSQARWKSPRHQTSPPPKDVHAPNTRCREPK
eukprot:3171206-Pyramimonas_sp.AAC.1